LRYITLDQGNLIYIRRDFHSKMTDQYTRLYIYRRIIQAKLFINTHFCDNLDLNNIASEAYFSKFHFIRLFKEIYGKTPHQYLIFVRIEKARLLLQTGHSVSEVCASVGFESLSSFSGSFKRMVGATPSAFLTEHELRKAQMKANPLHFIPGCIAHQSGWLK
jgi:AraC-like DNA-binding protein